MDNAKITAKAEEFYGSDDLIVLGDVEKVEGGYWVTMQGWVSNEDLSEEKEV
jgi:hypothetical protein